MFFVKLSAIKQLLNNTFTKGVVLAVLWVAPVNIWGQNHVVNWSFERLLPKAEEKQLLTPCTFSDLDVYVNEGLEGWQTFVSQTPDVLEMDSSFAGCVGFPAAKKGKRMVGLILYHPFYDNMFAQDYHEFLQGTLAKPLEKGKLYRVSVWIQLNRDLAWRHLSTIYGASANITPLACNNLGFYFSEHPFNTNEEFMRSQEMYPIRPQVNHPYLFETKDGEWKKLQFTFVAHHPYRYFLFGNFYSDAVTSVDMDIDEREKFDQYNMEQKRKFGARRHRVAYYLVDGFAVLEVPGEDPAAQLLAKKAWALEAAVLFDINSATLRSDVQQELEPLAELMRSDAGLKLEICGHTDDSGDKQENQLLSEMRAKAVHDWLATQGVAQAQLAWKGYGDTQPIASNDTEAGRAQNRRVELKVVD